MALQEAEGHERVVVVMWFNESVGEYGRIARFINRRVAEANGFAFINSSAPFFQERHGAWQKIGLLAWALSSGLYDAAVWVDADAAFMPSAASQIRALLSAQPHADIIFGSNYPCNLHHRIESDCQHTLRALRT